MAGARPGEAQARVDALAASLAERLDRLLDLIDGLEPAGDLRWRDLAACKDSYHPAFFPETGKRGLAAARLWCDTCPVSEECYCYAVDNDVRDGIWGGLSYRGRQRKANR